MRQYEKTWLESWWTKTANTWPRTTDSNCSVPPNQAVIQRLMILRSQIIGAPVGSIWPQEQQADLAWEMVKCPQRCFRDGLKARPPESMSTSCGWPFLPQPKILALLGTIKEHRGSVGAVAASSRCCGSVQRPCPEFRSQDLELRGILKSNTSTCRPCANTQKQQTQSGWDRVLNHKTPRYTN